MKKLACEGAGWKAELCITSYISALKLLMELRATMLSFLLSTPTWTWFSESEPLKHWTLSIRLPRLRLSVFHLAALACRDHSWKITFKLLKLKSLTKKLGSFIEELILCVHKVLEVPFNSYFWIQTNFNCAVVILVWNCPGKALWR